MIFEKNTLFFKPVKKQKTEKENLVSDSSDASKLITAREHSVWPVTQQNFLHLEDVLTSPSFIYMYLETFQIDWKMEVSRQI